MPENPRFLNFSGMNLYPGRTKKRPFWHENTMIFCAASKRRLFSRRELLHRELAASADKAAPLLALSQKPKNGNKYALAEPEKQLPKLACP